MGGVALVLMVRAALGPTADEHYFFFFSIIFF